MPSEVKSNKNINQRIEIFLNKFFGYLVLLIAVVVLLAGYFVLIKDQYASMQHKKEVDLVRVSTALSSLEREELRSAHINQSLSFTPAEEKLVSLTLPDTFDFPSLIIQLSGVAKKNNFVVTSVEVKSPKVAGSTKTAVVVPTGKALQKTGVVLTVTGGSYDNFKSLIKDLEGSIMIFDVMSNDFDSAGQKYTLNLVTYYYK